MKRGATIWLLLIAGVCFWQAGRLQQPLVQMRRELRLTTGEPLENTPPLVAFTTVALGGFRGVIADLLWLRASGLQQDGKYFELVQLADWITKLEPRMKQVWAFHAWNMAYNVSVLFNNPADRWRWVRQGIILLRDEGLRFNPGEPNLYRELGWIYQHKMSGNSDQMNGYYKRWWADEMAALFDGPRPNYQQLNGSRVQVMQDVYKLDPAIMQQVDREYGPLDWRLPQAHAIYWAWRGKKFATGFDAVQLDRMIFQSMADAALEGELFINRSEQVFIPGPNLKVFEKARKAYEKAIADSPGETSMQSGHRNFLRTAVMMLFTNHRLAEARDVFTDLRRRYPAPEFKQGLDAFVYSGLTTLMRNISQPEATGVVLGALQQSWFWLAMGDEDRAQGFQLMARTVWREYMKTRSAPEITERTGLPPFEQLSEQARTIVRDNLSTSTAKAKLVKPN
ncbi:MAG: hypothetical protein WCH84_04570 [Verrucomicrobiota bacterium]